MALSTLSTSAAGAGAPPPPTARRLLVSYLSKSGWFTRSHDCVGTPTKFVMFSSAMIGNALPASHLYMMTSLSPPMKQLSITGTQPVTWKRGTIKMNDGGNGSAGASGSSDANFNTALRAENAMSALSTARCVDTAPFGRPVVPEV